MSHTRTVTKEDIHDLCCQLEEGTYSIDSQDEHGNTLLHKIAIYANSISIGDESADKRFVMTRMASFLKGQPLDTKIFLANPRITNKQNKRVFDLLNSEWQDELRWLFLGVGFFDDLEKTKELINNSESEDKRFLLLSACVHFSKLTSNHKDKGILSIKWLINYLLDAGVDPSNMTTTYGASYGFSRTPLEVVLYTEPYNDNVAELAKKLKEKTKLEGMDERFISLQLASKEAARLELKAEVKPEVTDARFISRQSGSQEAASLELKAKVKAELELKKNLKAALTHYVKRIESDQKGNKRDFTHGFWVLINPRAANREANYKLAKKLIQELDESSLPIHEIFSETNLKRSRSAFKTGGTANNSADLNYIFKSARNHTLVDLNKLQKAEEQQIKLRK